MTCILSPMDRLYIQPLLPPCSGPSIIHCSGWRWVVFQQGWKHTQTLLWSGLHNAGFSLRSPHSQALNDSFINVFKCSLCPCGAMSDAEAAWINKIGFLPSRNQSDVGAGKEGGIELVTNYKPDAYLISPHRRNYGPNLQIRKIRKREVTGPGSLNEN